MNTAQNRPSKNRPFHWRLRFALAGLRHARRSEHSFRVHLIGACVALVALLILRPAAMWWALVMLSAGFVLAAELFNTAIECLTDHLHPDEHPSIKHVKDCAAAAVLVASITSLGVAAALVWTALHA